ncbi:MAG: Rieske 2Fe-2S domain-containing protein [Spongiibacteraceae bacterium]|jgi:nitrite reductase/ring-hydroxylating ferredoxin subunit|nr:Rieske 2Fe-2S domain-containing protein [Spongiibacteraceae bacterium]
MTDIVDASEQILCRLSDIEDGDARGCLPADGQDQLFVVRRGAEVVVYLNSCPHNWRPLEYRRHQFLAPDHSHIICYAHGAHFEIDSGYCFAGPCEGKSLVRIPSRLAGDCVVVPRALPPTRWDG